MKPIALAEILNLYEYEKVREARRAELIALKRARRVQVGGHRCLRSPPTSEPSPNTSADAERRMADRGARRQRQGAPNGSPRYSAGAAPGFRGGDGDGAL